MDVKLELDDPSTHEEIKKATMQLKAGESPGIDGILSVSLSLTHIKLQKLFSLLYKKVHFITKSKSTSV